MSETIFLDEYWNPVEADSAVMVKVIEDDGRVRFGIRKREEAGPLMSALNKLFPNSFEGHRGRPGQRGGSLPRDAAGPSAEIDRHGYALDKAFASGGITIKATGLPNEPTKGYVVAEHEEVGDVIENAKGLSRTELKQRLKGFIKKNINLLSEDEMCLGLWLNNSNGSLYMDVSSVKADRDLAIQAGIDHDQIAIWDIENGVEIQTGGSGKKGTG